VFFSFMEELRSAGISASLKEHLALLEALNADVISQSPEEFYYLARTTLVKDEALLDRFDQVFSKIFKGVFTDYGQNPVEIPEDWLKAIAEKYLSPEEMANIEQEQQLDRISPLGPHPNIEPTLPGCSVNRRVDIKLFRRTFARKFAQTAHRDLDITSAKFACLIKILKLAFFPNFDGSLML